MTSALSDQKNNDVSDSNPAKVPKVDMRNKKEDILSAYEQLVEKFQENAAGAKERQISIARQKEEKIVEKASGQSLDSIMQNVSQLEGNIRNWIGKLVEALSSEVQKLHEVQEALAIEKKQLEEIHRIKVEADAFASLVEAHNEKKRLLEDEYKKRQEEITREISEKKLAWEHEKDEYSYNLQLIRRRDEVEFQEKKVAREKMLSDREKAIAQQEVEFKMLRELKDNFDDEIKSAVIKAKNEAIESTARDEEVKATILAEKTAADKYVAQLTIEALKKHMTERELEIANLKRELEVSNRGVKDIALKVIEGTSRLSEQHRAMRVQESEKSKREVMEEGN